MFDPVLGADHAARGAYVLRQPSGKGPVAGTVYVQGTMTTANVVKVLPELEREGLVEARRGLGTFVRRSLGSAPADSPLHGELLEWAARARTEGLDRDDVAALFTAVLEEKFPQASSGARQQPVPQNGTPTERDPA